VPRTEALKRYAFFITLFWSENMCIRTANGRFLACCSFLVVIMFGLVTEAFAQREMGPPQPSGGEGRNVILPPGDGNGNSGGNPGGFPWWLQPNGNIPIPGSGIGNPIGGDAGSRGSSPVITTCPPISCTCSYDSGKLLGTYNVPGCQQPSYSIQIVTLTKHFVIRAENCDRIDKSAICRGRDGYKSYNLTLSEEVYSGCGSFLGSRELHTQTNGGSMDDIPRNVGQVAIGPSCNGGY
jgi:hypothetical protein